jgi:hypothetical protein
MANEATGEEGGEGTAAFPGLGFTLIHSGRSPGLREFRAARGVSAARTGKANRAQLSLVPLIPLCLPFIENILPRQRAA